MVDMQLLKLKNDGQIDEKLTYNIDPLISLYKDQSHFELDFINLSEVLNKISATLERFLI